MDPGSVSCTLLCCCAIFPLLTFTRCSWVFSLLKRFFQVSCSKQHSQEPDYGLYSLNAELFAKGIITELVSQQNLLSAPGTMSMYLNGLVQRQRTLLSPILENVFLLKLKQNTTKTKQDKNRAIKSFKVLSRKISFE